MWKLDKIEMILNLRKVDKKETNTLFVYKHTVYLLFLIFRISSKGLSTLSSSSSSLKVINQTDYLHSHTVTSQQLLLWTHCRKIRPTMQQGGEEQGQDSNKQRVQARWGVNRGWGEEQEEWVNKHKTHLGGKHRGKGNSRKRRAQRDESHQSRERQSEPNGPGRRWGDIWWDRYWEWDEGERGLGIAERRDSHRRVVTVGF